MRHPGIYYVPSAIYGYKIYILLSPDTTGSRLRGDYNAIMLADRMFIGPGASTGSRKTSVYPYTQKASKHFERLPRSKQRALAEHIGKYYSQQKRAIVRQIFKAF